MIQKKKAKEEYQEINFSKQVNTKISYQFFFEFI